MHYETLIDQYLAGSDLVGNSVAGMTEEHLDVRPIAGKWSTRQVVCHLADFEPIYADRMKRVIAEQCPTSFGGDPDTFAAGLAYERRSLDEEISLITAVRRHMRTILCELKAEDFQRTGNHSDAGLVTLESLLRNITEHAPHHVRFIVEKRQMLGI